MHASQYVYVTFTYKSAALWPVLIGTQTFSQVNIPVYRKKKFDCYRKKNCICRCYYVHVCNIWNLRKSIFVRNIRASLLHIPNIHYPSSIDIFTIVNSNLDIPRICSSFFLKKKIYHFFSLNFFLA